MRSAIRNIVGRTYKPFLEKYLSRKRIYNYGNIRLEIAPEVFHPGFFTSTLFLLQHIKKLELKNQTFLELGAGSGLISMYATKHKASVVASDINPVAVHYLRKNATANNARMSIIESDLFDDIPEQQFDIVAINPPYYKKKPLSLVDHAWYCGENGEFFSGLFASLPGYIHQDSEMIMVLCEGCDMEMIKNAAATNGFRLRCIDTKQTLIEKNFIYKIELTQ